MMAEYIVKTNEDGSIPFSSSGVKTYEEIIRCRDCKIGKDDLPLTEVCKTYLANGCDPNGFCTWAVRR